MSRNMKTKSKVVLPSMTKENSVVAAIIAFVLLTLLISGCSAPSVESPTSVSVEAPASVSVDVAYPAFEALPAADMVYPAAFMVEWGSDAAVERIFIENFTFASGRPWADSLTPALQEEVIPRMRHAAYLIWKRRTEDGTYSLDTYVRDYTTYPGMLSGVINLLGGPEVILAAR